MKNSTILTIILIAIVSFALYSMYGVNQKVEQLESKIDHKVVQQFEAVDPQSLFDFSPLENSIHQVTLSDLEPVNPENPKPVTPTLPMKQPTLSQVGPSVPVVPLPLSGRFYESGEFHMVGHISRMNRSSKTLPVTLPLYGQRIAMQQATWNYAVLYNNSRLPVYTSTSNCMSDTGCIEFQNEQQVVVPDVDDTEVWKIKLYTKL